MLGLINAIVHGRSFANDAHTRHTCTYARTGTLARAWRSWVACVSERRRLRAVAKKVVGHWRNRLMSEAMEKWWHEVKHVIEQDAASAKKTLSEMVRGLMPHIISYSVGGLKKRIQLGY